jgi:hypothetical protein
MQSKNLLEMRLVKRVVVLSVVVIFILLVGLITAVNYAFSSSTKNEPFYVGVTYCGNSTADAKLLIDKVKNYTNLFMLQSGPLMQNLQAINEIGDYTVANGLHFASYFSMLYPSKGAEWVSNATQRWGNMFAGIYYGDEPAGRMLDSFVELTDLTEEELQGNMSRVNERVGKNQDGSISTGETTYYADGKITVTKTHVLMPEESFWNVSDKKSVFVGNLTSQMITYYPNGSITIQEWCDVRKYHPNRTSETIDSPYSFFTMQNGSDIIAQQESYQQVKSKNPIPDCNVAADLLVNANGDKVGSLINYWQLGNRSFPVFTSDYALYWWDYQSGYNMILAELGWNNTLAQEIGLVRGAANLQGKDWGTIITWKYTQMPYLPSEDEMFEQMKTSYESGASYVIIFSHALGVLDQFGTLKDEHFVALERFWNEVVQNPFVAHGGVKAEAVFVLPENCGWGLRNEQDTVWGLWQPTQEYQQFWPRLQDALRRHGQRLDIVVDDSAYPVAGKYSQIYYWNQTS